MLIKAHRIKTGDTISVLTRNGKNQTLPGRSRYHHSISPEKKNLQVKALERFGSKIILAHHDGEIQLGQEDFVFKTNKADTDNNIPGNRSHRARWNHRIL